MLLTFYLSLTNIRMGIILFFPKDSSFLDLVHGKLAFICQDLNIHGVPKLWFEDQCHAATFGNLQNCKNYKWLPLSSKVS